MLVNIIYGTNENNSDNSWINDIPIMHRNIFRGNSLGNTVTAAQLAAISDGSFDDLYIGDYWTIPVTINGTEISVKWRIADMDYFFSETKHHLVIVPDEGLYTAAFYSSSSYPGYNYLVSLMHTTNLDTARTVINTAFPDMVLSHDEVFGSGSSAIQLATVTVEIMDSVMILGNIMMRTSSYIGVAHDLGVTQFALFRMAPKYRSISDSNTERLYWARSEAIFNSNVIIHSATGIGGAEANRSDIYVRPYFLLGDASNI